MSFLPERGTERGGSKEEERERRSVGVRRENEREVEERERGRDSVRLGIEEIVFPVLALLAESSLILCVLEHRSRPWQENSL